MSLSRSRPGFESRHRKHTLSGDRIFLPPPRSLAGREVGQRNNLSPPMTGNPRWLGYEPLTLETRVASKRRAARRAGRAPQCDRHAAARGRNAHTPGDAASSNGEVREKKKERRGLAPSTHTGARWERGEDNEDKVRKPVSRMKKRGGRGV